jgi:FkbM family methyltransferase
MEIHVRAIAWAMNTPETRYAESLPLAFRCACGWMKYAPRAKSWVPRRIGRTIGRGMTCAIRTRAGALLAVDPVNLDFFCQVQLHNGVWEEEVLDACLRVTQPGDTFFDVGANAGIVTVDVARTFGESVMIHAFEPQPTLARTLAISIGLNEFTRVHLHRVLLGDVPGQADLYVADHAIHSSLVSREAGATRLNCRIETIDRLVADGSLPPPTVIKIDVEGAELRVLRGARNTFRAKPPVIVFEADDNMARFGYTHRDLFELLREFADYSFHRINGPTWVQVNSLDDAALGDYVALPPSWRR